MKATERLRKLGQSLWLDNITRGMLDDGTLARYIREYGLTGLTSNPTIFEHAIGKADFYDAAIRRGAAAGRSGEELFFDLALEDLTRAADLFRPTFDATAGVDGWVSLEVSPLLAHDAAESIRMAAELHARGNRPNLFVKIPGTREGLKAIEESIYDGVPINMTLLFSAGQYRASAEAYLRAVERRIAAGRDPRVASVASLFVSRWDVAVHDKVPATLRNRLGIAVAMQTYRAYRELLASTRWQKLEQRGARPQRLLWGSTGTKDPAASDTLYVDALVAPETINTLPDKTLAAVADHAQPKHLLPADGGNADAVVGEFRRAGVDDAALAEELQRDGTDAFTRSWHALLREIGAKSHQLSQAHAR
jgi:transaldolase